ncbi:hypothetical protein [Luteolibacter sp. LG18]|uniref:hypothetical protein n=1 Tax=Luteolibacter sp. LG18 TaxID=2819286 RepID=UPI002B2A8F78|nr:hypothetical protein llg_01530 [Luteolibacter sp. LG18]
MNRRVLPGLLAWTALAPFAAACGPFFPDTVLDKPQAALDVPPVSYMAELHRIAGTPMARNNPMQADTPFLAQIPLEEAQLRLEWQTAGVPAATIDERLKLYVAVRTTLLTGIDGAGLMDFPVGQGGAAGLIVRPIGDGFPADVSDYVEGARLLATGHAVEARTLWKSILGRPAAEKRLRGTWAAWMLAKTSTEMPECLGWYERVEKEAAEGGIDILRLSAAAKSWRASQAEKPVERLRLFYDAFRSGKDSAALDVRQTTEAILATKDAETLDAAAGDPVIRRLLNLHLQALLDGPRVTDRLTEESEPGDGEEKKDEPLPPDEWLAALEAHAPLPLEEGARLAWALYAAGRYDEAFHWLEISVQTEPLAQWLRAKFDLRSGDTGAARQHLASAIRAYSATPDWKPDNPYLADLWLDGGQERLRGFQGRLLADAGMVALSLEDRSAALDLLATGGYDEDAAYIAEQVLSTDELLKHVREKAPMWEQATHPRAEDEDAYGLDHDSDPVDPATCLEGDSIGNYSWNITPKNRLRYELARRLAREGRLTEAGDFMPPALKPLFAHYRALDEARLSGRFTGEALAAITWREARIHRYWGAELFSSDGAPDGGIHQWAFEATDFAAHRAHRDGWTVEWKETIEIRDAELEEDRAVPMIHESELQRVKQHPMPNTNRFHYRYIAAELAGKAADSLPDNHPQLAPLYNTAGQWLAARDPKAADVYYQAMVKRCKETEMGQAADKKRWFLGEAETLKDLPGLPAELMPNQP